MGGQDGNRGYLVQTIIALLESLRDPAWESVQIEPDDDSPKVDILWLARMSRKALQVKSSINQVGKADAERWAGELRSRATADQYELILVGPCAQSVVEMGTFQDVFIRCKNLDVAGLLDECAHKLDKFIEAERLEWKSATQRELMVNALTTHLSSLSTRSRAMSRAEFIQLLKQWIGAISPTEKRDNAIVVVSLAVQKKIGGETSLIANLFNQASYSIEIKSAFIRVDNPCHPPEFQEEIQFGYAFYHTKKDPFDCFAEPEQLSPTEMIRARSCVVESQRDVYFRLPPMRVQEPGRDEFLAADDARFKFIVRSAIAEIGRIEGKKVAWAFKEYLSSSFAVFEGVSGQK